MDASERCRSVRYQTFEVFYELQNDSEYDNLCETFRGNYFAFRFADDCTILCGIHDLRTYRCLRRLYCKKTRRGHGFRLKARQCFGYYLPNLKLTPMYNTHSYASTAYIRQAISKQHVIITQYIIKTYGGALASP